MGDNRTFDHHAAEHAADPVAAYRSLREGKGSARSDRYGGFTVFTRYDDIVAVARDHETYSSALRLPGDGDFGGGDVLPRNPSAPRTSLAEMDQAEWRPLRRVLNPFFSPEAMARFRTVTLAVTTECIDRVIESGRCDIVLDICSPVPAIVTLRLLGLPTDQWENWAVPIHTSVYTPRESGHPEWEKLQPAFAWIFTQLRAEIQARHAGPRENDLISTMMYTGEGFDDELIFETVYTLLAAGVDTTTSLLSAALMYLSQNPDDRARLRQNPDLLELATEEFLRYYSPEQNIARTVTTDVELAGESFHRGDRVLMAWGSANRDASRFDRPDDFVIDRNPNRHLAFGSGIHRCVGAPLARQESVVVIGEILRRMPDYRVDVDSSPTYPDVGLMFGFQVMPAVFTPGPLASASLSPACTG